MVYIWFIKIDLTGTSAANKMVGLNVEIKRARESARP